jgi:hypothetical protein
MAKNNLFGICFDVSDYALTKIHIDEICAYFIRFDRWETHIYRIYKDYNKDLYHEDGIILFEEDTIDYYGLSKDLEEYFYDEDYHRPFDSKRVLKYVEEKYGLNSLLKAVVDIDVQNGISAVRSKELKNTTVSDVITHAIGTRGTVEQRSF